MNSRTKALTLTALVVGTGCGTAEAAFYNANFGGGKNASGYYYFDDPANWGGGSPKYTTNATDPGLGLNTGTQLFTLTNDFTSTRIVVQAAGSRHGIDLGGHTLTMKGSIRHYTHDNSFTVTNGTLSIPAGPYQVSSIQNTDINPCGCALSVAGPTTTLDAKTFELSIGNGNSAEISGGATVKATLNFGTVAGPTVDYPFKNNSIVIKDAGTVFENKSSAFNLFNCGNCVSNRLEVSGGALFTNADKMYATGTSNALHFADNALPALPTHLSIIGGTGNVIELSNVQFSTLGSRLNMTAGTGHRISLQNGSRYSFTAAEFTPFSSSDSMFEVTGGSVFARTNGSYRTFFNADGCTMRVAGAGSKFLYDGVVYVGEAYDNATFLVEDGGALEWTGPNSGSVYVGQRATSTGDRMIVRGENSLSRVTALYVSANGGSFSSFELSDGAVNTNTYALVIGWWKNDPADAQFSNNPGGTNTISVTAGAKSYSAWLSTSGVGNTIAVTNGLIQLEACALVDDERYGLAIPDVNFEKPEAIAKLKTIPRDTHIMIGGTNSVIKTTHGNGNMRFAKNTDFSFEIPATGYCQAPIQSSRYIKLVGCGKMTVNADAWIAAHPNEKVVLMEAAVGLEADDASLAAFNSALPPHYRVRVKGKQLLFEPVKGLFLVVK